MFAKLSNTWTIMRASFSIVRRDKELVLFSLLSSVCCMLVLASFAIPMVRADAWMPPSEDATTRDQVTYYSILFLFYFCNYFVIVFFNAAIVACTIKRLGGGDPTFGDGIRFAVSVLPQIFAWAVLSATVGVILRIIEDRSEKAGRFVAGLLGMAWTVLTFLVVPVLVVEKLGPIAAFKRSTSLLKKTWGEQLVSGFGFGLLGFLMALPVIPLILIGFLLGSVGMVVCFVLAAVYLIIVALVNATADAVFRGVLYAYAESGSVPEAFDESALTGALHPGD